MSDEKWSPGDELRISKENSHAEKKNEKGTDRKLSWQEPPQGYNFGKIESELDLRDAIKLEKSNLENGSIVDQAYVSDGELMKNHINEKRDRERRTAVRSNHRRVKSLCRFEVNQYTIADIRKLHERLATPQNKPLKSKCSFFNKFTQSNFASTLAITPSKKIGTTHPVRYLRHLRRFAFTATKGVLLVILFWLVICFLWLLRRVKKLERLTRLDEDIPNVSPFITSKGIISRHGVCDCSLTMPLDDIKDETCGLSSSKRAADRGMSTTTLGFVFSFYAFVIFISSPFLGKILPRVGAKFLLLSGLFLTSTCNFLFGLLGYIKQDWVFCTFCFLIDTFEALGASAYCTASYVFVAEVFPTNIGAVLGFMETFVGLGMSIGPAMGGFLYHIGGFGLPFYALGAIILLLLPIALWLLPSIQGNSVKKKSGSFFEFITEPSVIIIGLVIVISSNVWAFLDPTLEPHLRQFNLTPEKIGLIFLLFSALYGLSSPLWGIVADKSDNHWGMMTAGLLLCTIGLLLLGPAPFIPFLKSELWLDLVALSLLGISLSLSILPTFQGLQNSISVTKGFGGQKDLTTYSIVAGTWSSLYALGEVIGPLLGGVLTENYGFPVCCAVMAATTFTLALGSFIYFAVKDCLSDRGKNYRYRFEDSDGYDSDYTDSSEDLETQSLLQPGYQNRIYIQEKSF